MQTRTLIFDFDGTIADTHHYIVEISNILAQKYGYNQIDMDTLEELKHKTAREMVKFLNIPVLKIPAIIANGKKLFHDDIGSLEPFNGIDRVFKSLKEKGAQLGILSSNSKENVHHFLELHGFDIFDFIHTTPKVWSKNTTLKRLLRKKHLNHEDVIYVGDETRDIDAAKKTGIKIASVTWGYNSKEILSKFDPDYIIDDPEELLQLI